MPAKAGERRFELALRRVGKPALSVVVAILGLIGAACNDDAPATTTETAGATTVSAPPLAPPPTVSTASELPAAPPADIEPVPVLAKLATLEIKGRAPKTGYARDLFGDTWTDDVTVADGHNGCDTRNDILRRDLVGTAIKQGSNGCAVLSGTLHDPYTGTTVEFRRGPDTSAEIQIDHVVALSDAWQKGAQQWDMLKRRNFANDPVNLQATVGSVNQRKGDGDAATWLPPNRSYRCDYVSRIVDVKAEYGLWVTQAEHDAIARILTTCQASGPQTPSAESSAMLPPPPVAPASIPPGPPPPVAPESGTSVYYSNCAQVREAGAAPLLAGQPGYHSGLDGDGDGVACER
ncbi:MULTISPECIES: GmrSD restriction endonuclease domain-containing protein [Mycolicibacterium]|uniref:DUF1524 domain-containing protein n=1 Tax=Mycolicibacterium austroafricanum TaxID=39687 RepID=A0ABT8HKK7_MYCAO|nr:DUF1524 domain-containing protein [Mycolicibacterium austroafricanum]MDN4521290.1 DUF1524 domain-containing protein [Mycolicibacterium austroafricanum]